MGRGLGGGGLVGNYGLCCVQLPGTTRKGGWQSDYSPIILPKGGGGKEEEKQHVSHDAMAQKGEERELLCITFRKISIYHRGEVERGGA